MTKAELVEIIAKKAHLTKKATRESIDAFLDEIVRQINKGEKLFFLALAPSKLPRLKIKKVAIPKPVKI